MSKRNNKNASNGAKQARRAPLESGSRRPASSSGGAGKGAPTPTPPARGNSNMLTLVLIGVGGAVALGMMLHACTDDDDDDQAAQVEQVERARYDSQAACLADWNQPSDCGFVCEAPDASGTAANGASAALASASDAAIDSGLAPNTSACAQTAASTQTSGGGHGYGGGGGGHSSFVYAGHWYGPYYTQAGTVYHANGTQTRDAPSGPLHGTASSLLVRSSSLHAGSDVFSRSPRSVSVSEGRAISRGGFTSGHGGGGGHGSRGG
ncbi:conserved hypothetical protein [Paraburkholderia tropica]|uniref:hypothetical protein n=1 Tax=Paraburkholderia tropica TaxID=92647 RepID=UPI001CAD72C4|nr:hypothetical protein [Paraburkholderia tropica]CAG9213791.1 conserved hypothetical protein [Paraburkholderia tropica]